MSRRIPVALLCAVIIAALDVGPGVAQEAPPKVPDALRAYSIVPPGQEGEVTVDELIAGDYGEHYNDQLEMYASLINMDDVTDEDLPKLFHSMQFGTEAVADSYSPTDGVTVYRDDMGIPHIYADDLAKAGFALGYVTAEDRMWEMDVFRHAARGTLAALVGPGVDDGFINMDIAIRREGYTEEEVTKMFDSWDERFGAMGKQLQAGLLAYTDGVNEYISELMTQPNSCSGEYQATGNPCPLPNPAEWNVNDTLFLAILQLRLFGETAGSELQNAGFYAQLQKQLGPKLGARAYKDFLFQNEKSSPTTITASEGRFPSQNLGRINRKSFAIPDNAQELARETTASAALRERVLRSVGFPTGMMSNALTVSGSQTKTANPMQIGAPQVGYAVPSFFMDIDVHVPSSNVHYRGPAVPGASALIPLGRGADYAWSLTTGVSDAVDVKIEKLCNPDGGDVDPDSDHYLFKRECKQMESRTETFAVKMTPPPPGDTQNPPRTEEHTFYRTVHGPVFARGAVRGDPVAFVKNRFFWGRELDSIPAFYRWNTEVRNVKDFRSAASTFSMNFNAFYADAKDIGWFHVGYLPKRPRGMHPSLPTWGTGRWEFDGRFPFNKHPQVINPAQGWIANWNNKPAVGWDATDHAGDGKWGAVQRVSLLQEKMHRLLDGPGKAQLSDLVDVIRESATQDTRGVYVGPTMLKWARGAARGDAKLATALAEVRSWILDGAHRINADGDDQMDDGAALALFDKWWDLLVHAIYDDEFGDEGYALLRAPISDYSPNGGSSFFFDFSSYLKTLFDPKRNNGLALDYCDDRSTKGAEESCRQIVEKTFEAAYRALVAEQGDDIAGWTAAAENLIFQALGAGSVDPIPWQNRGTHNHVVEILRDLNLPYPPPS